MEQIEAYKTDDGKIFTSYEEAELHEKENQGFKHYYVELSYDGYASIEVWAKDKEDAIEEAKDQVYQEDIYFDFAGAKAELREN